MNNDELKKLLTRRSKQFDVMMHLNIDRIINPISDEGFEEVEHYMETAALMLARRNAFIELANLL